MSQSFHLVFINFRTANGLIQLRSNMVLRITDQLTVDVFKNTSMNIWRIEWGDTLHFIDLDIFLRTMYDHCLSMT